MFTGIIETVGKVSGVERGGKSVRLSVWAGHLAEDVSLGDSVAISGVCLTVVEIRPPHLTFDAVYETLRRSSLEMAFISFAHFASVVSRLVGSLSLSLNVDASSESFDPTKPHSGRANETRWSA